MTNLATNLTTTAANAPRAGRPADQRPGRHLRRSCTAWPPRSQERCAPTGSSRATGSRSSCPTCRPSPSSTGAILLAGGIVVPMNPLLKAGEIDYFFTDSGAKLAFVWPDFVPEATKGAANSGTRIIECGPMGPARAPRGRRPDRRARTSAPTTTPRSSSTRPARPAGPRVPSSPTATSTSTRRARPTVIQEMTTDDVVMGCLPLFHVFGLVVGLNAATSPAPRSPSSRASTRPRPSRSSRRSGSRSCRACRRCTPRSSTTRAPTAWTRRPCAPAPPAGRRCRSR